MPDAKRHPGAPVHRPGPSGSQRRAVHLARVHHTTFLHIGQHRIHLGAPHRSEFGSGRAGVHERLGNSRQEAVVDKKVFFDVQDRIAPLQVARAVAFDPVAQGQVLRSRRGANRVRLHKTEFGDSPAQGGGRKQGVRYCIAAQGLQFKGHLKTPRPNHSCPAARHRCGTAPAHKVSVARRWACPGRFVPARDPRWAIA